MKELGLAILGCGPMGSDLARQIDQIPGAQLAAVVDIDVAKAQALADELGVEALSDANQALARKDIDAVIIATPGSTHAEWTIRAFDAGKHVFVEKPMALQAADCERMIQAARTAARKLMVGQVLRYYHVFAYAGELFRQGRLGEPSSIRITRTTFGWGGWMRPWRASVEQCGGVLFEVSIHELDFMLHLFGEATEVHSFANHTVIGELDYPDTVVVNLRFASGAIAQLTAGLADRIGSYAGEIVGTEGSVHFNARRGEILVRIGAEELRTINFGDLELEHPVRREVREFIDAVRDDRPVTIPGEEGLRVVRVACAAVQSAGTGKIVRL